MRVLERIEDQMTSTNLPLVGITLAAVPCPDTPVILTLHWHGFIKEKLAEVEEAETVSYTPIPSSALQVNDRWKSLGSVDFAAMEAAWTFGAFPFGINGSQVVVSDAPDADDLVRLAAERGYLMWIFRPVKGGIWAEYADDATLGPEGTRPGPCPHRPIPPICDGKRQTIYRFGVTRSG